MFFGILFAILCYAGGLVAVGRLQGWRHAQTLSVGVLLPLTSLPGLIVGFVSAVFGAPLFIAVLGSLTILMGGAFFANEQHARAETWLRSRFRLPAGW